MSQLNSLLAQVDRNFDELLSLHRDLVRIPLRQHGLHAHGE